MLTQAETAIACWQRSREPAPPLQQLPSPGNTTHVAAWETQAAVHRAPPRKVRPAEDGGTPHHSVALAREAGDVRVNVAIPDYVPR